MAGFGQPNMQNMQSYQGMGMGNMGNMQNMGMGSMPNQQNMNLGGMSNIGGNISGNMGGNMGGVNMDPRYMQASPSPTSYISPRQQKMLEQKLRRLIEHSMRLREQLDIRRITVSEASNSLVTFVTSTPDPLLPSVWGPVDKKDDPFAAPSGGCGDGCMVL